MARLAEKYHEKVIPALMEKFHYQSIMEAPRLVKVVINVGLGAAIREPKLLDAASEELAAITGQKPITRLARKAIAALSFRQKKCQESRRWYLPAGQTAAVVPACQLQEWESSSPCDTRQAAPA